MMNGKWLVAVFALVVWMSAGCSVYMAATQPDKKDMEVLKVGAPRNVVMAELGTPATSEMREGKKVEIYSFVQGYDKGTKIGRTVFHGAADVATLGIWEVVGTPTESTFDGDQMVVEVTYDTNDRVEKVVPLKQK